MHAEERETAREEINRHNRKKEWLPRPLCINDHKTENRDSFVDLGVTIDETMPKIERNDDAYLCGTL